MPATLTSTDVDSTDVDPVGASAIPSSPTAYPSLMYPGQTTPAPPDALTSTDVVGETLSSQAGSQASLSSTATTKGTLTPS